MGLCQPHAPLCSGSVRDALQRLAHDDKDRFGQISLSSMSGERRGLGSWGLEECHLISLVGHGLLIWDPGVFLCLLDNSCQRPTSLCGTHLGQQEGEVGSCGASHLGWGGDFYLPPPSSSVFFCSQYSLGLSHSRSASKACTSPAVLFHSLHPPRH